MPSIMKGEFFVYASIIVSIISVVGSFILVYLSVIKDSFDQKRSVQNEQLEKFYIPFYKMYCRGFMSNIKLSSFPLDVRLNILDLMSDNIQFLEPLSQSLYPKYYRCLLDLIEAEDLNPHFPLEETQQKFDDISEQLIRAILNEYKDILKKCHLPVPSI